MITANRKACLGSVVRLGWFSLPFPLPLLPLCRHPPSNSKERSPCPSEELVSLLLQNTWAGGR